MSFCARLGSERGCSNREFGASSGNDSGKCHVTVDVSVGIQQVIVTGLMYL